MSLVENQLHMEIRVLRQQLRDAISAARQTALVQHLFESRRLEYLGAIATDGGTVHEYRVTLSDGSKVSGTFQQVVDTAFEEVDC